MQLRQDVKARLVSLVDESGNPAEVADWAMALIENGDPELRDEKVWRALERMSGADLMTAPGTYLHGPQDFEIWLADFIERQPACDHLSGIPMSPDFIASQDD